VTISGKNYRNGRHCS